VGGEGSWSVGGSVSFSLGVGNNQAGIAFPYVIKININKRVE
jgi:hypothetical protein